VREWNILGIFSCTKKKQSILWDTERQSRACPFYQKRFPGRKKFYAQPNRFSHSTTIIPQRTITLSLSHPSFSLRLVVFTSIYMFLYIYYIIYVPVAFFISRHVSKKVTLPEWHIFLAGTINSHHSKITSRTMNNGPYFYRNLSSLSAACKPYTQLYTRDGAAGGSIVPANYLYGGDIAADAIFVIAEMLSFVITYYISFGNMLTAITTEK